MDQYVVSYRNHLESINKSPHTIKQYGIDTAQFLDFMQKNNWTFETPIVEIVEAYNKVLEENYASLASINRKRASLKHFLKFLWMRKLIQEVPEDLLKPTKQQKESLKLLTEHQVNEILNYWLEVSASAQDSELKWLALRNFCIVNVMVELGLKPSETTRMKWSHINKNEITILQRKRARKLDLSTSLLRWLMAFRKETEILLAASQTAEYVWLGLGNKQNDPITVKTIERIYQSLSKGLGFKVTATSLRYTLMNSEVKNLHTQQLSELYQRYGYARKSVLVDRINRFQ